MCTSDDERCSDCGTLTHGEFYLNFLVYWKSFIYVLVRCHSLHLRGDAWVSGGLLYCCEEPWKFLCFCEHSIVAATQNIVVL